jgi:hypothetical protein
MDDEPVNAQSAGVDRTEVERLPYHSPKFVSLGPIQSLVQSGPSQAREDGGTFNDGTSSGV